MYYEYPEVEEAYTFMDQYYFGSSLIVAPITDPLDKKTNLSLKEIWLPEGKWFEWTSGTMLEGGKVITRGYALNDIPVFIKAGSIIPQYPKVNNLDSVGDKFILNIIPGGDSEVVIYDDDGTTNGYQKNQFTKTMAVAIYKDDKTISITLAPRTGSYKNMPKAISYEIRLPNTFGPISVIYNNTTVNYSYESESTSWTYDGNNLETIISLPYSDCNKRLDLTVEFSNSFSKMLDITNGVKGNFKRLSKVVTILKAAAGEEYFLPDWFYGLEQTPSVLTYYPENAASKLNDFSSTYNTLAEKLSSIDIGSEELIPNAASGLSYSQEGNRSTVIRKQGNE